MGRDEMGPFIYFSHPDWKKPLVLASRNPFSSDFAPNAGVLFEVQTGKLVEPKLKARECVVLQHFLPIDLFDEFENGGQKEARLGFLLDQFAKRVVDLLAPLSIAEPQELGAVELFENGIEASETALP